MSSSNIIYSKNVYENRPNIEELAHLYPEFRKIVRIVEGRMTVDFKDEESSKVVAEIRMKHDFGLEVKIPQGKIIPAIPLRVNYIMWLENLLTHTKLTTGSKVSGLDIGTGAICVYPLLIAKMYGWQMTCTESDLESALSAKQCVEQNNFSSLIQVNIVNENTIFQDIPDNDEKYTFVTCNPAFRQLDELAKLRNKQHNVPSTQNFVEEERLFVTKMIQESEKFKDKVSIFTVMCGQKTTLKAARKKLMDKSVKNMTWTEFSQGFTKRWGLAWTFMPENIVNLLTAPTQMINTETCEQSSEKAKDMRVPVTKSIPSIEGLVKVLFEIFTQELKADWKKNDDDESSFIFTLTWYEDSWSHAPKKRKMEKETDESTCKKMCLDQDSQLVEAKEKTAVEQVKSSETEKQENSCTEKSPYLVCSFLLQGTESDGYWNISMFFDSGSGGVDAIKTLKKWLINKLDANESFFQQKFTNGKSGKNNKKHGRRGKHKSR